jgi:endo-1,4-beta-xylanase
MVRSTRLEQFPEGWGDGKEVLRDVHEAVHVYKVKGRSEFHMVYERNDGGVRSFGLATSADLEGPWRKVTDNYATGTQLEPESGVSPWTEMVSHGEVLRSGHDERMEYQPNDCRWLIQGIRKKDLDVPYPALPWKLGLISRIDSNREPTVLMDAVKPQLQTLESNRQKQ